MLFRSTNEQANSIDMVQLDSVFVSPILSKSTLEAGAHLRLRVLVQCKYLNETCLAELKLPLKSLLDSSSRDNLADAGTPPAQASDFILDNLLANLISAGSGAPLASLLERLERERASKSEQNELAQQQQQQQLSTFPFNKWWPQADQNEAALPVGQNELGALELEEEAEAEAGERRRAQEEAVAKAMEQNYFRSLMVSHWLNYLVAPAYECSPVQEARGSLLLGLTYLPTSNRVTFSALRASIELEALADWEPSCSFGFRSQTSGSASKQLVKQLRLQSDTVYLLRILMLANGRILKRRQTRAARQLEWNSAGREAPLTFDLVNVAAERPAFVVALVLRSRSARQTGDGQPAQAHSSSRQIGRAHV